MPLTGQERHFADQIDGLLARVDKLERFLGGRWKVADAIRAPKCCHLNGLVSTPLGWHCNECGAYCRITEML